ncbi:hypothetical protein QJS66_08295 [Kocuria rhizophila]|nr:hypothetical protein QJS66_08295 [Kocuria rhizophila]
MGRLKRGAGARADRVRRCCTECGGGGREWAETACRRRPAVGSRSPVRTGRAPCCGGRGRGRAAVRDAARW